MIYCLHSLREGGREEGRERGREGGSERDKTWKEIRRKK